MLEDTIPAYGGFAGTLTSPETMDMMKQAGMVAVGSIAGAYLNKTVLSMVKGNSTIASAIEAGLGILGGGIGARNGNELLEWVGIGAAAHGIAALITSFIPIS